MEREREAQAFLDEMDAHTETQLRACGVSKREARAAGAQVPDALKRAMAGPDLTALLDGRIPANGWGLGGDVGGGKTCGVVSTLKIGFAAYARRQTASRGIPDWSKTLAFVNWPEEVDTIRKKAIDPKTTERLEWLAVVPLLVLDDLGRERIKGSYVDDWAASQLDSIVNARYREELPTIWTTNCHPKDLVLLYGPALYSRLDGANPLIWVDGLPDLRRVR